jgi:hypothetical protein
VTEGKEGRKGRAIMQKYRQEKKAMENIRYIHAFGSLKEQNTFYNLCYAGLGGARERL